MSNRRKGLMLLIVVVAAIVFAESFAALREVARQGNRPHPDLWPTALEAVMVILGLLEWDARATGKSGRYLWTIRLVFGSTVALSTWLQVLGVPEGTGWKGWLTAGWTPLALFICVEILLAVLHSAKRATTVPEQLQVVDREIARLRELIGEENQRAAETSSARAFLQRLASGQLALPAPPPAAPAPELAEEKGATSAQTPAPIPAHASSAPPMRKAGRPALRSVPPRRTGRKRQSAAAAEALTEKLRVKLPAGATAPDVIWSTLDDADQAALTLSVFQQLTGLSRATAARRLAALRDQQSQQQRQREASA